MDPADGKSEAWHSLEIRSFGRRRGRKLSARQERLLAELLPRVGVDLSQPSPSNLASLFPPGTSAVWLEIGFGGAEHLMWQARENLGVGLIGCEPFEEGVVKALAAIEDGGLGNVRLHCDDVRPLIRWLPERSVSRVFMLFPDPWPKKRHQKRRLFSVDLLNLLARVMVPGAELRLATDIGDYARTALRAVAQTPAFRWTAEGPADWRVRPPDWPETRYEAKAGREGRRCYFFRFIRG
ncbi:tRNA (guanine(46)-N(7))-methyltransferase TrmB [Hyphomicrobium sp.]|uniref:tRNA (guanine(46)-N(7))-methyltransferase TrmB n=1 Tax=Hyphomicrobium sp. TaxID=82 RepID=UPI0025C5DB64|nr:tRNA (guanine(46)-N(7))-methyltransferase TrmB [Hyphomicrobium sp.]MCC7252249.1 tRNA (guanosine(46)-N7)-methyltransferase TrmB [Hyphomicrobium sp.]